MTQRKKYRYYPYIRRMRRLFGGFSRYDRYRGAFFQFHRLTREEIQKREAELRIM